jgi:hypothetical protein
VGNVLTSRTNIRLSRRTLLNEIICFHQIRKLSWLIVHIIKPLNKNCVSHLPTHTATVNFIIVSRNFVFLKIKLTMKNAVFWGVAPCSYCIHRRGCSHLLTLVPRSQSFLSWRWRRYVPPKRRFIQYPHGAKSQKTLFFIVTAVKTSNLTKLAITALMNCRF